MGPVENRSAWSGGNWLSALAGAQVRIDCESSPSRQLSCVRCMCVWCACVCRGVVYRASFSAAPPPFPTLGSTQCCFSLPVSPGNPSCGKKGSPCRCCYPARHTLSSGAERAGSAGKEPAASHSRCAGGGGQPSGVWHCSQELLGQAVPAVLYVGPEDIL